MQAVAEIARMPKSLPLLGHALKLLRDPLRFLEEQRPLGDAVQIRLGLRKAYILNSPELVRKMLGAPGDQFDRGVIFEVARPLFGNGVVVANREHHRERRRAARPAFQPAQVSSYANAMVELAEAGASSWHAGQVIDLHDAMADLTTQVVAACLFGVDLAERDRRDVYESLPVFVVGLARRAYGPLELICRLPTAERRRYTEAVRRIHDAVDTLIEAAEERVRATGDPMAGGMLAMLQAPPGTSAQQVHDDVLGVLIGGSHTTAAAAAWIFHFLAAHPDVESRLTEEVDRVLQDRRPDRSTLTDMPYLQAVIYETLRIVPPVWLFPRRARQEVRLGDHLIPAGADVFYSPYALHHDPRYFPAPDTFDPQRWLSGRDAALPRGAFFPFASGTHHCLGADFAMTELAVITAAVVSRWRLRPVAGEPVRPKVGATLGPSEMRMRVEPR
ncbi:cytochrome P450 [Kitasatospora sp. NPDC049285]|uniref:cytochrome P450 n=1 Tax=Kitasatospora sp. NPDC049285 TaxID=3157096 RepID=UPI00341C04E6